MVKDELLQVRVTPDQKERLRKYAKENGYEDVSKCIIDIIEGKLDPKIKYDDLTSAIQQALLEDPSLMEEHIRRIGIRYFVTKQSD